MAQNATIFDETPDGDTIGGRLSRAREAAGLSEIDLAWRLGVARATVQAWERDRSQPGSHRLSTLSGLLGVSLSWILHGVGTRPEGEDFEYHTTADSVGPRLERLKLLHLRTGELIGRLEADFGRLRDGPSA